MIDPDLLRPAPYQPDLLPASQLTNGQRIGLSIVGMFYGEVAAAVLLCVAILLRNANDIAFVRAHLPAMGRVLLGSCALEGAVSAFMWLLCAVPLVVLVAPEWFRVQRGRIFLAAAGLGLMNGLIFAAVLWLQTYRAHIHAHAGSASITVTLLYGFVMSAVALWRYLALAEMALVARLKS